MQLNFPDYNFQIKTQNNKNYIFDVIRKKHVVLTPEEWVRQHTLHYLINNNYPKGRISVERGLPNSKKRYDAIVYDKSLNPFLLVECKAPSVKISQATLNQVTAYIALLNVPHILLTNGLQHYFISRNKDGLKIVEEIPSFTILSKEI